MSAMQAKQDREICTLRAKLAKAEGTDDLAAMTATAAALDRAAEVKVKVEPERPPADAPPAKRSKQR